jgi:Domain of unknown function (DUF6438)
MQTGKRIALAACLMLIISGCNPFASGEISKIVFENGPCFGSCPVFYLEIDSSGKALLFAEYVFDENEDSFPKEDTSRKGFFRGVVERKDWLQILNQLKIPPWENTDQTIVTDISDRSLLIYREGKIESYDDKSHHHPLLDNAEPFFKIFDTCHWERTAPFRVKRVMKPE